MRRWLWVALAAAAAAGCATTSSLGGAPVNGRPVTVEPKAGSGLTPTEGELIAVGPQQALVLQSDRMAVVPREEVRTVTVPRRTSFSRGSALTWALVGGVATGLAMTVACSNYGHDSGCGSWFVFVSATWALGGVLPVAFARGDRERFDDRNWEGMQRFARFPQGLPAVLDDATLAGLKLSPEVARAFQGPQPPGGPLGSLHAPLEPAIPNGGTLRLSVSPGAAVEVDERSLGTSPLKPVRLSPGVHVVKLTHPDYYPVEYKVTIRPGETTELNAELRYRR